MERQKIVVALSIILGFLVAGISLVGILTPHFYHHETSNWQVQSFGQDIIDLVLVVPALLLSTQIIKRSKQIGMPLWGGVLLYLIYTFVIYAFDVHFNRLFFFYCLALGLSFYLFAYFLYDQITTIRQIKTNGRIQKATATYFIIIGGLFYLLWLSEVIPASIANQTPASLIEVGLPTNPVHVLDLAIILPAIFITGILLLKGKRIAHILTPVLLVFFTLMDVTIATLSYLMMQEGHNGSWILISIMGILAILSLAFLTVWLRSQQVEVIQ